MTAVAVALVLFLPPGDGIVMVGRPVNPATVGGKGMLGICPPDTVAITVWVGRPPPVMVTVTVDVLYPEPWEPIEMENSFRSFTTAAAPEPVPGVVSEIVTAG